MTAVLITAKGAKCSDALIWRARMYRRDHVQTFDDQYSRPIRHHIAQYAESACTWGKKKQTTVVNWLVLD